MGPQSQRRLNQKARTHKMQANNVGCRKKRKAGDQLTLDGSVAFAPFKHCVVCKARAAGVTPPHRGHHKLCWINRRTKGITSKTTLESLKETERLRKLFAEPIKFSSRYLSDGTSFFAPRISGTTTDQKAPAAPTESSNNNKPFAPPTNKDVCHAVINKVNDKSFAAAHAKNRAPLAMIALASVVVEKIINPNR